MPLSLRVTDFPYFIPSSEDEREQGGRMGALPSSSVRLYHSSAPLLYHETSSPERSAVAITLGLGAISASAYAASLLVKAYNEWQASRPEPTEEEKVTTENTSKAENETKKEDKAKEGPRENIFAKWFDVGGKYYEGGFEDSMTRREAALVLGVRESSSVQRIKDAHRKLLILNHPDTGGSTYLAGSMKPKSCY
jgi:DnaJ homolog subfamily C member 19